MFGRTWQVIAQADGGFRDSVEDIGNLRTRNVNGEMVPIGSMVKVSETFGPDPVIRYNGHTAADLMGEADPAILSSAEAMEQVEALAQQVLPNCLAKQWTDVTYQQAPPGKTRRDGGG